MADFAGKGALISVVSKRFMRDGLGTLAAALVSIWQDNPWFLAAKPLLAAVGKWGREKYSNTFWNSFPF